MSERLVGLSALPGLDSAFGLVQLLRRNWKSQDIIEELRRSVNDQPSVSNRVAVLGGCEGAVALDVILMNSSSARVLDYQTG